MERQIEEKIEEIERWDCFSIQSHSARGVYVLEGGSGVRIDLSDGSRHEFIFGPYSLKRIITYNSEDGEECGTVIELSGEPNSSLFDLEQAIQDFLREGGRTEEIAVNFYDGPAGGPAYGETHHWVDIFFGLGKTFRHLENCVKFEFKPLNNPIEIIINATTQEKITYVLSEK